MINFNLNSIPVRGWIKGKTGQFGSYYPADKLRIHTASCLLSTCKHA